MRYATSGEKPFEEFFSPSDDVNWDRHEDLAVINGIAVTDEKDINNFIQEVKKIELKGYWDKAPLVEIIQKYCPTLTHIETGKFLDGKM